MVYPRVFISSTCYDLKDVREYLKEVIESIGYTPVLSDKGDVYYDAKENVQDACLIEVETCQILVLIIGGRYGSRYKNSDKSITNMEYKKALENKIPIFSFVKKEVYQELIFWRANKKNKDVKYTTVDSIEIFEFIEEVESAEFNNGLSPFENIKDIQSILIKQLAGMLYQFLTKKEDEPKPIIKSSRMEINDLRIKIHDMTYSRSFSFLKLIRRYLHIDLAPGELLENETLEEFLKKNADKVIYGEKVEIYKKNCTTMKFPRYYFDESKNKYKKLRKDAIVLLSENDVTIKDFLSN